ncbi:hypothetical protein JYU34_008367 [Plutella xylostella]|uniref:Uncharacterized protein n=1 Tax=Plutella xylostella TaxID=51655 RepID=A0ABQ7QP97_PLUXY|nr:hypothetical protein JYU34_008340 [Plutella xylostella]KAG7306873.1 hypothetical protein JYU34_008342 [Plutella xylostella]KAG7306894.1 hypothetical protein JYU34_008367 [Plutella xylostella]
MSVSVSGARCGRGLGLRLSPHCRQRRRRTGRVVDTLSYTHIQATPPTLTTSVAILTSARTVAF